MAYIGGLPGDGWDGNPPLRGSGTANGSTGILQGEMGQGEIQNGSLVITHDDNVRLGELSKITRVSPTMGRKPPEGAIVLFDGTTADHFENGMMSDDKSADAGCHQQTEIRQF